VPELLQEQADLHARPGRLVAGTKYRGEFEERLKKVMKEITPARRHHPVHRRAAHLVGAGAAEGAIDAANDPQAGARARRAADDRRDDARRVPQVHRADAALERRFQQITSRSRRRRRRVEILKGLRDRYEAHHRVQITDEALEAAAELPTATSPTASCRTRRST
jgi:ATP-dependent Clp protease ATP-binding subunit ClpC